MLRPKNDKKSTRLSVTLYEAGYAELARLAVDIDLSAAWMIRSAISELIARRGRKVESELPLHRTTRKAVAKKSIGEARG